MHTSTSSKIEKLLDLTLDRKTDAIKKLLESESRETKGSLFENYLAELYKGNGWLAVVQGGRCDAGADILLYHPDTPSNVALIIQAKNHKQKLTFDDTKIELIKFEEQASEIYQCKEYSLFSISGYVQNAQKLAEFNMSLHGWDKIVLLIHNFNTERIKPTIELHAHNLSTYKKILIQFETKNRVSCVQATGTGKSYLIAQLLIKHYPRKCLVVAPSNYILRQQERLLPSLNDNIIYMTYAKIVNIKKEYWQELNPAIIVIDEFHRAGAKQWSKGIQRIFDANPTSLVFGTSATHIRYLDNARNMVDEVFEGTLANEITLQDAIAREILPVPLYINAMYTLNDEISSYREDIKKCNHSEEDKLKALNDLEQLKINWEESSGMPNILRKHLPVISGKYIVFCESITHLDVMQDEVSKWFRTAAHKQGERITRHQYLIESTRTNKENNNAINLFEKSNAKNSVHLLFAVDMLNEGLHLTHVNGVFLLRKTISPTIHFQQIGRCFNAASAIKPIIFDLVNNIHNIHTKSFQDTINEALSIENERRHKLGLKQKIITCNIIDETKDLVKELDTLDARLGLNINSFQQGLEHLITFHEVNGHCRVPHKYTTENGYNLGTWISARRRDYKIKRPSLTSERIKQLEELDLDWDLEESYFQEGLSELIIYKEEHGDCKVEHKYNTQNDFKLGKWVSTRRQDFKTKNPYLNKQRIKQLNNIGFIWDLEETKFHEGISELTNYKNKHGHCRIPSIYVTDNNFNLGAWVSNRRQDYKLKSDFLTKVRIAQLEILDFCWDVKESEFQQGLSELKKFKKDQGHCLVHAKHITEDDFKLGGWVSGRRKDYKNKIAALTKQRINEMETLGFDWDPIESDYQQAIRELSQFINEYGHCRVDTRFITPSGYNLGKWVSGRRQAYNSKSSHLTKQRIKQLETMGFIWNASEADFQYALSELEKFREKHGHVRVPNKYISENNFNLGRWVSTRRKDYKNNNSFLNKDRIAILEKMGFEW